MSQVTHMNCPACKGALGVTNLDRFVDCAFCGAHLLVEHPDYQAQYYVSPVKDAVAARRALQKFLTSRFLPKGLLSSARFLSATLCYVPFFEFRTRRLGTIETGVPKTVGRRLVPEPDSNGGFQTMFRERRETVMVRETEMVMGDICRIEPAATLSDFGLEHSSVRDYLKGKPLLHPFKDGASLREARVYPVTLSAEKIAAQLQMGGFSASVVDDTEYVESRTRIIYFPIWRMKYRFAGRLYSAVLDGITGDLLRATAPEGDQMRVKALLFGVGFLGVVLGAIFKETATAEWEKGLFYLSHAGSGIPMLMMLAILVLVLGTIWVLVWNQFRWAGEVHKIGGEFHVEKYNGVLRKRICLPLLTAATLLSILVKKRE